MKLEQKMSEEYLKTHIYCISLLEILETQQLSYEFVCLYILNSDFQLSPEEKSITIADVCKYQPHLIHDFSTKDLHLKKIYINWPNFEEISNKE